MEFDKILIKEIIAKGNLDKEGLKQYLKIWILPEVDDIDELTGDDIKYSKKWSVEIGKIVRNDVYTKPTSLRSDSPTRLLILILGLVKCYIIFGGNVIYLKEKLNEKFKKYQNYKRN